MQHEALKKLLLYTTTIMYDDSYFLYFNTIATIATELLQLDRLKEV